MSTLDGRGKGFEDKFAHDEEIAFKAKIKRNHLFSNWVADQVAVSDSDRDSFLQKYNEFDMSKPDIHFLIDLAEKDLEAAGIDISEHRLENKLEDLLVEATALIRQKG